MKFSFVLNTLLFALPFASGNPLSAHHQEVARRARADVDVHQSSFSNARFTFYDVGLGACGEWSQADQMVVALNVLQFGAEYPGPHCFETITITYNGQSVQATIVDKCMGCPWSGLDFSRGLFNVFANEGTGVLYGDWEFDAVGGGEQGPPPPCDA